MARTKVQSELIATNAISGTIIADGAITSTHLAANCVDSSELVTGSIDTIHIAANQVTATKIVTNGVLTRHISDDQVTAAKLANSINTDIATGVTANTTANAALPKAGGTLTGALTTNGVINTGTSHNFALNTPNSLRINIDSNNSATDQIFVIGHNQTSVDNNNALMTILESGKVGIGTSSPAQLLEVSGNGGKSRFTRSGSTGTTMEFYSGGTQSGGIQVQSTGLGISGGTGENHVFINTSGKLLMGTTTSGTTDLLQIESPANAGGYGIQIRRNDNNTDQTVGRIMMGNVVDSDLGMIAVKTDGANNSGAILFKTALSQTTAERMRIDSSGDVRLGANATGAALIKGVSGDQADRDNSGYPQYTFVGNEGTGMRRVSSNILALDSSGAERMRIDASGNVGIGTGSSSINAPLEVSGGAGMSGGWGRSLLLRHNFPVMVFQSEYSTDAYAAIGYDNSTGMHFMVNSPSVDPFSSSQQPALFIRDDKYIGIGTTSPLSNLTIGGTEATARVLPRTDNVGYIGESTHRWIAIYAVNGSIQTSDEREKTEIKETTLGLDFIKDLKPVSYKWIDGKQQNKGKDEREHQGLVAQQVAETVEKHGVNKNDFGGLDIQKTEKYDDFYGMSYDQFVAPLIKAIQEQQTIIDDLKSRIATLEG